MKIIQLVLGLVALLVAQSLASAVYWLNLSPSTSGLRFPPYFGLVVLILVLATILLALAFRRSAQRVTRDIEWLAKERIGRVIGGRATLWGMVLISVIGSALSIYSTLAAEDAYPNPVFWFISILATL